VGYHETREAFPPALDLRPDAFFKLLRRPDRKPHHSPLTLLQHANP
jgi:hypothetical protein